MVGEGGREGGSSGTGPLIFVPGWLGPLFTFVGTRFRS